MGESRAQKYKPVKYRGRKIHISKGVMDGGWMVEIFVGSNLVDQIFINPQATYEWVVAFAKEVIKEQDKDVVAYLKGES